MAQAQNNQANGAAGNKQQAPADANKANAEADKKADAKQNKPTQAQNNQANGAADARNTKERVFYVPGYGNVTAKSEAEAAKKAKQIVADLRK